MKVHPMTTSSCSRRITRYKNLSECMRNVILRYADTPTLFSHNEIDDMKESKEEIENHIFKQFAEHKSEYGVNGYNVTFRKQWNQVMLSLHTLVNNRLLCEKIVKRSIRRALIKVNNNRKIITVKQLKNIVANKKTEVKNYFIRLNIGVDETGYLSNFFDKHFPNEVKNLTRCITRNKIKKAKLVTDIRSKIKLNPGSTANKLFSDNDSYELTCLVLEDSDYHSFDGKFLFGKLDDFDSWGKPELLMYVKQAKETMDKVQTLVNPTRKTS